MVVAKNLWKTRHVFIDTSVYVSKNFFLVDYFRNEFVAAAQDGTVEFHTTSITQCEIAEVWTTKDRQAREGLAKIRRDFGHEAAPEEHITRPLEDVLADLRLYTTREHTGETVPLHALTTLYRDKVAPFDSRKKKSEFKDAIAALCLKGWADMHEETVLVVSEDGDWDRICASPEYSDRLTKSTLGEVAAILGWPPRDFEAGLSVGLESGGDGLLEEALPGCRAWLPQREGRSIEIEAILSLSDLSFKMLDAAGSLSEFSVSVEFSAWAELEVSAGGRFKHMTGCQLFGLANMVLGKHYMIEHLEIAHVEMIVPSPSLDLE